MGYGVVRPSLGPLMNRVRLLALVHFAFGVLYVLDFREIDRTFAEHDSSPPPLLSSYSLGTVLVPLETAGFFVLLFVFPLAFTLTAFMMWSLYSLNATIADLSARKQTYKRQSEWRPYLL
jgi:hypothetical protein